MSSSVSDGAGRDVAQPQKVSTKLATGFGPGHSNASICARDNVAGTLTVRSRLEPEVVVHHLESDRGSNAVVHPTEPDALMTVDPSDLLLRANRFSPLSAEIDEEPLPPIVGVTRRTKMGNLTQTVW